MTQFDPDLALLEHASNEELQPLVEYILDTATNMLNIDSLYKKFQPNHTMYPELIEKEIRTFGGNSFANMFRENGPPYKDIVCDVANKLGAPFKKTWPIDEIEMAIIAKVTEKAWSKMTEEEKAVFLRDIGVDSIDIEKIKRDAFNYKELLARAGGYYTAYAASSVIAGVVAVSSTKVITAGVATSAASLVGSRVSAVLLGPIGWAIGGAWTAFDIAGPAFRVVIPCVLHIAFLRLSRNTTKSIEETLSFFSKIDAIRADSWGANIVRAFGLETKSGVELAKNKARREGISLGQEKQFREDKEKLEFIYQVINPLQQSWYAWILISVTVAKEKGLYSPEKAESLEKAICGLGKVPQTVRETMNTISEANLNLEQAVEKAKEFGLSSEEIDEAIRLASC